ncbi:polysaccharide pyruvyl transferase family protein [Pseudooceanicola onchidii]|uniref:polysaccharide pyruvyl transferase family protein n=1 Tax=Pseudooceanicola onchidii TaxID=2562279 RepID=UPI0010A9D2D3|nr:polysaccharide pyruvyl transferase family protein [Pseudooceanicola onchidii]
MTPLTVQVLGIDPANKGACLMLAAIRDQILQRFPGARVAVDIAMPFEDRLRMGVWAVTPADWSTGPVLKRLKGQLTKCGRSQREKLGLLHSSEIDVILDSSGFAYGDFWGNAKMEHQIGRFIDLWKAEGKVVIALPQAWGPFTEPGFAAHLSEVLSKMDLVFARDRQSAGYLREVGVTTARDAPDFTNLLQPTLPEARAHLRGAGFIVPNSKMLEAYGDAAHDGYLDFLVQAVACLRRVTPRTCILVHEGHRDMTLAEELNNRLDTPAEIVDPADAVETKAIIGAGGALISSRFHGLVSGLSAGVPSLACGWSHKYEELLADYGMDAHLVRIDAPQDWPDALARFAAEAQDPEARARLATAAQKEKARAKEAWQTIDEIIRRRPKAG